jgi:hypothetical protein
VKAENHGPPSILGGLFSEAVGFRRIRIIDEPFD